MMKLVLASKNQGKLKELSDILHDFKIEVVLQSDVGVDIDVEETGVTFEENAMLKAKAVFEATGMASIADDSGLVVDALNGEPGVYSARYGNCKNDKERTAFLLENLKDVPEAQRTARFVSVIACCFPDGSSITARGACEGRITRSPMGDGGFGYDPVFFYEPAGKTFSQLTSSDKNKISHRATALREFINKLKEEQKL